MSVPDMDYLKQIGEFCVTYGPWAVAVFEGLYILKIQRDQRSERKEWEESRVKERLETIKRYQEYHEEIVKLVDESSRSKTAMASKMLTVNNEVKILRKALEQYFSLITEGIVRIVEIDIPEDIEQTISDFMPETNLKFTPTKKKGD